MLSQVDMISTYSDFFEPLLAHLPEPDEAAALLADLLMSSTETAIVASDLDGRIVLWSAAAARMYGYSPAAAIGRSSRGIVQSAKDFDHTLESALRLGRYESTSNGVTPAGESFTARLVTNVRHDSAGRPVGFIFVAQDISGELRLRAELRASQLMNAELGREVYRKTRELDAEHGDSSAGKRMKTEFLANMSHELRTPLNGIIGFSELLFDGKVSSLDQQHHQFLGHILNSSRHLLQLVDDVLDLTKVDAGQMVFVPERVDVDRLARQVRDVLRPMAVAKRQQVRIDFDGRLGPVVADIGRLKQVLYNLLSNAIKFTPEAGRITIRVQPVGDAMFRLSVEDNGVGVQSEDIGRLFVEFEQLDAGAAKLQQGTGLGLALTKRIVEAQGGMVAVQSSPGSGSIFSAVLPRELTGDLVVALPDQHIASLNGPTILVVEEEPRDRRFLEQTFSQAGYMVDLASTLADGLARCQERSYDAITLDLVLPDGEGLALVRAIRAGGPNVSTPVVVISVLPDDGRAAGFAIHGYLTKPLVSEVLIEELARIGTGATILVLSDDAGNREAMAESLRDSGYRPIYAAGGVAASRGEADTPAAVVVDPSMLGGRAADRSGQADQGAAYAPILAWAGSRLPAAERAHLDVSLRSLVLSRPK